MTTKKREYLDYEAIKRVVDVSDILGHYKLTASCNPSDDGKPLMGTCPICKTSRGKPFHISEEMTGWYCVARCKRGGNILDLVAAVEGTDIHEAAYLLHQWFDLKPDAETNGDREKTRDKEGKGFLQDVEEKIRTLLAAGDDNATVKYVKDTVLESYRNGIEVGKRKKKPTK